MKLLPRVLLLATVLTGVLTAMAGWSGSTVSSAVLTAATLVWVREGLSPKSRVLAFLAMAWVYWGLTYLSNIIEAFYFEVIPGKDAALTLGSGLITSMAIAGLLEMVTTSKKSVLPGRVGLNKGMWWRVPVLVLAFIVLYLAAGAAIYPWVANFYAGRTLPTMPQLFRLQFGRGLFDLACIYPVYRQWFRAKSAAVWMSAGVFTVLCGWAPLLLPNAFLPARIRLAHAVEMGAFGVAFGALAVMLLLKGRGAERRNAPTAGAGAV